jgi:hypothetical protein
MNDSTSGEDGRQRGIQAKVSASDILACIKISAVYQALGGPKLRHNRGPAFWRAGDGFNVSLDDGGGLWHDFTTDEGGGVLDLVVQVRGGSRATALRWLADLAGIPLSDEPLSAEDRQRWAAERRALERDLPAARFWRRAAVNMAEDLLDSLKAGLSTTMVATTTPMQPEVGELMHVTKLLARLKRIDGAALVTEYHWWLDRYPGLTAAMVASAKRLERSQRRALLAYLHEAGSERAAA